MNQIRMPSPAILVAVLALVAALAGTAVAGPDASTSASKKTTKKIANRVATKQINKLAPGLSVLNAKNAQSATNAENAQSATNAEQLDNLDSTDFRRSNEAIGASDLGTITQRSATATVTPGNLNSAERQCNTGEQVLSGGNDFGGDGNAVAVVASRFEPPNGWSAFLANNSASDADVTVRVYCLEP